MKSLLLHPEDNVVIMAERLPVGAVPSDGVIPLKKGVPARHKIARHSIAAGAATRKIGQPIGFAAEDIPIGAHVDVQNCAFSAHQSDKDVMRGLTAARAAPDAAWRLPDQNGTICNGC